jgi:hypothetical protein
MRYIQERSFIATVTSRTPGYEGLLDSFEFNDDSVYQRTHRWLSICPFSTVEQPQRFWFGYYDGDRPGYRVRAVEFADGDAHYQAWELSGQWVCYHATVRHPVLWRLWAHGNPFGVPTGGVQDGITVAAVGSVPLGVRNRKTWENRYVEAGAANKLFLSLNIEHVGVQAFDSFARFREFRR